MTEETLTLICPPVRTQSYSDENPISFLVRLANLNTYPSYRWLLSGKYARTINYELLLVTLLSNDWAGYAETVPELEEICILPSLHINSPYLRYCPLCLQEQQYWRIGWQIKLSSVCSRHHTWLEDLCPHCHGEQSFQKMHGKRKTCLEKLPNAKAIPAPLAVIRMQQFLETGMLNPENNLFDADHQLSLLERSEFIAFLLKWIDLGENETKPTRLNLLYVRVYQDKIIQCAEALFSDQSGFWRYLQTMHMANANYIGIQQKRLIYFYREFFKQFSKASFKPLRDVVENYATMNLVRDITQKHTLFSPNAKKVQLWYSKVDPIVQTNIGLV